MILLRLSIPVDDESNSASLRAERRESWHDRRTKQDHDNHETVQSMQSSLIDLALSMRHAVAVIENYCVSRHDLTSHSHRSLFFDRRNERQRTTKRIVIGHNN